MLYLKYKLKIFIYLILGIWLMSIPNSLAQISDDSLRQAYELAKIRNLENQLKSLETKVRTLELTELVQSMCQRSILTPVYLGDLKPLLARQAYNFWISNSGEKYVSHLNVYAALYYACLLYTSPSPRDS